MRARVHTCVHSLAVQQEHGSLRGGEQENAETPDSHKQARQHFCSTRTCANRHEVKSRLMLDMRNEKQRFTQTNEHLASFACHWIMNERQRNPSKRFSRSQGGSEYTNAGGNSQAPQDGWSTCGSTAAVPQPGLVSTQKGDGMICPVRSPRKVSAGL